MIQISKWRITALVALGLTLLAAVTFAVSGYSEEALRSLVRATARTSLLLFVMAMTASSLYSLFSRGWSKWLLQNRRYIGVSFALSHGVHLVLLILLGIDFPESILEQLQMKDLLGGGLAYVFILAMTITSFQRPRAWIGEKAWHVLHSSGIYFIWLIFFQSYLFISLKHPAALPGLLLLIVALSLRLVRNLNRKQRSVHGR